MSQFRTAEELKKSWAEDARWQGIERPYTAEEVVRLRGTVFVENSLARRGAELLWDGMNTNAPVYGLGALTGNQAMQQVAAGLPSIYVSGWQTAGDANTIGEIYPDQSLYPVDSVPTLVRRINQALMRADQIAQQEGRGDERNWLVPIVADAEAGFGGLLNCYELMKHMIQAGAAGVHYEDQLASAKKCGHLGGKVLISTSEFVKKLLSARLAADVLDVPSVLVARTDANAATLLTNDIDPYDHKFLTGEPRSEEGFFRVHAGLDQAIARGLAYAPYADVIWCETSKPDLGEARDFAQAIHEKFPGKHLAYNCSPSFNWTGNLDKPTIAKFRDELASMGYAYQFITLAGFHALNLSMFELATGYKKEAMTAYSRLQDREFELQKSDGYAAIKHQSFVGTGYFDLVATTITQGHTDTTAYQGSTEEEQFK